MTREAPPSTYEDDFFAWTQEQAMALRRMPAVGAGIDVAHVAEEIEDLGKRDLREVRSVLARFIEHLIKIDGAPTSPDVLHWRSEARAFRNAAVDAFSPGMRQLLDVSKIWRVGWKDAQAYLSDVGIAATAPLECPFDLDDVLSEDFDLDGALDKIANAKRTTAAGS